MARRGEEDGQSALYHSRRRHLERVSGLEDISGVPKMADTRYETEGHIRHGMETRG